MKNEIYYTTIRPLGPRSAPPPTRALCPLRAPAEGLFATSRMLPRPIRQPDARQRPRASFAHEPRSRGGRRTPRGRVRSIGGTQLSWETTYPPRLSARRQTTTTSRLTPEPRALVLEGPDAVVDEVRDGGSRDHHGRRYARPRVAEPSAPACSRGAKARVVHHKPPSDDGAFGTL